MAKQTKKQKLELATLDANNIVELDGWKAKQQSVIKENPFIEIVDRETYEVAKTRRTALVSARTGIQSQDKTIGSFLSKFRKQTMVISKDLIAITEPFEAKQQKEVSRYEEILDEKRREKELEEQKRIDKIQESIEMFSLEFSSLVDRMMFETIDETQIQIDELINTNIEKDFEEYQPLFVEKVDENQERFFTIKATLIDREETKKQTLKNERIMKIQSWELRLNSLIDHSSISDKYLMNEVTDEFNDNGIEFGDSIGLFNEMKTRVLDRAKTKMESLKIESERQKEVQIQAKINSIWREASVIIDQANGIIDGHSFENTLKKLFEIDFDFGKHKEEFEQTKKDLLFKANEKTESLKVQSERQKEVQMQENKNRIMNVREGLLDKIFQMTTDDYSEVSEYVKDALSQANAFPDLRSEFDKMISMVTMNFNSKMKLIESELEERKQEAIDARIAIDARTAKRGKQLEKIGFTFNEQKSENFWNHLSIDLELWETMIEGLSDDEWTPYLNDIQERIQDANKKNKAFQERAKRLMVDKKIMIDILDAKKLPRNSGFSDKESIQLFSEIQKSFDLFMKTQVERINKF
jgi:hypothetical protein